MKRMICLSTIVFVLISQAALTAGQVSERPLPTAAEIFQEAVDVALEIDSVYYFLIVQTIHAQRDCKDVEGIRTTVAKTLPHIRAIPEPENRYAALEALASAIHKADLEELAAPLFEEAVQTARDVLYPPQRVNELITLSAFRSFKQNKIETIEPLFNEAKEYALSLTNDKDKSHALVVVVARELQFCGVHRWDRISQNASDVPPVELPRDTERILPYLNQALETIQAIPEASIRDAEYVKVVDIYVKMGEYTQALEIILRMETINFFYHAVGDSPGTLIAIAQGLSQLDNLEQYENLVDELIRISGDSNTLFEMEQRIGITVSKVRYARFIISVLARLGRFDEAMQWGKSLPVTDRGSNRHEQMYSGPDLANFEIAMKHGREGKDEEAIQYLNRVENNFWRNTGFWQLANDLALRGEYEKAIENVMQIDENQRAKDMYDHWGEHMRPCAFRSVAKIQFEVGKRDESLKTLALTGKFSRPESTIEGSQSELTESGLAAVHMLEVATKYAHSANKEATVFFAQAAADLLLQEEDSLDKGVALSRLLTYSWKVQEFIMVEEIMSAIVASFQKECENEKPRHSLMYTYMSLLTQGNSNGYDMEPLYRIVEKDAPEYIRVRIDELRKWRERVLNPQKPNFAKMLEEARANPDLRFRCDLLRNIAAQMSGANKWSFNE